MHKWKIERGEGERERGREKVQAHRKKGRVDFTRYHIALKYLEGFLAIYKFGQQAEYFAKCKAKSALCLPGSKMCFGDDYQCGSQSSMSGICFG